VLVNNRVAQHGLQATGLGATGLSESLLYRPAPEPGRWAAGSETGRIECFPNSKPVEKEIYSMDATSITHYITHTFADVEIATAEDYTFFFYGSDRKLPFATLATQDNDYDRASNLNRSSVFRLNIGVSKDTYRYFRTVRETLRQAQGMLSPHTVLQHTGLCHRYDAPV